MLVCKYATTGGEVIEREVHVAGDGNCFFRAVIEALRRKNISAPASVAAMRPGIAHLQLRLMVVRYADVGGYPFSVYTCDHETKARWLAAMSTPGGYADDMAVRVCSDVLGVPIRIAGAQDGAELARVGMRHYRYDNRSKQDNCIRLRLCNNHYSVLLW